MSLNMHLKSEICNEQIKYSFADNKKFDVEK